MISSRDDRFNIESAKREVLRCQGDPPVAKLSQGNALLPAWSELNGTSRLQPNQRLQLPLPPFGERPLAVLRGGLLEDGKHVLVSFVRMTPMFRRGAAETHNR